VNSQDKHDDEFISDFRVQLQHPISNVKQVGVQSFSSTNNSYNVTSKNRRVKFLEQKVEGIENAGTFDTRIMTVNLPIGYYTINELLTELTRRMTVIQTARIAIDGTPSGNRQFAGEGTPAYSYSINEKYEVTITATSANTTGGNKYWGFYSETTQAMKDSLIHSILGYEMNTQIVKGNQFLQITNSNKDNFKQSRNSLPIPDRSYTALHSYSENSSLLYLASDILSSNSIATVKGTDELTTTKRTNILEQIHVNVGRYSFIHLTKFGSDVLFHNMNNTTLTHFDLKLMDQNFHMGQEGVQNYRACIIVETNDVVDHIEQSQMHQEYDAQGYNMIHR
jgi:hypothetical protein